ncbi:protein MGARP [Phascolarctos cinereus]|uniref:Protein MGARP n=1 Tax=Phascolarctos cinereus TaxID=38626 RepID=A0A6P5IMD3_PHACI|nr:protein MGARP [Phascolarctos cinereus]XP_020823166.1 protein MGARP [Phascolarctos cinereus]
MYLRRAVGKTLTLPLRTPLSSPPLLWKHASLRQMSAKRVPELAGSNMIYYLFVGVTVSAGGYYAYRTFTSDQSRYTERINNMQVKSTMRESPETLQHPDEEVKPTETNEGSSEAPKDTSSLEAGLATAEEIPDVEDAALEETSAVSVEAGSEETLVVSVGAGPEETQAVSVEAHLEISEVAMVSVESGPEVTFAAVPEVAEASDKAPKPEEASAVDTELEEDKKSPPEAETCTEAELQEEAPPQA